MHPRYLDHGVSTPARRALGSYLADLRNKSGFSVELIAEALGCSTATLYRYQNGTTPIKPRDAEAYCRLLKIPEDITKAVMARAEENITKHGWWQPYLDAVPEDFEFYLSLEDNAQHIRWYEPALIPGILQTVDCARELLVKYLPDLAPERLERKIEVRMGRRKALTRNLWRLSLDIIIDESVLRRPIDDPTAMADQIAVLYEASELPNVTLRALPFDAGTHPGLSAGSFEIIDFQKYPNIRREPTIVYSEGFLGALYYDEAAHPESIHRYARVFDEIAALTLSADETRSLLAETERAFRHDRRKRELA